MIGLNYDILDETDKISLKGKISYEEASKTLLSMSNNNSPGSDGFTAEFLKMLEKYRSFCNKVN